MRADHDRVLRKLKIARGQLDGLIRMVEEDRYCVEISNQLLATQALLQTDHVDPKLEEALDLLRRMCQ